MQQPKQRIYHNNQTSLSDRTSSLVAEAWLQHFEIPVTEFIPGELTNRSSRLIKLVAIQHRSDFANRRSQPTEHPAVLNLQFRFIHWASCVAFQIHERKTTGIPQLVAEVATVFKAFTDNPSDRRSFIRRKPRAWELE